MRAPYNVTVNAIASTYIRTPLTETYLKSENAYQELVSAVPMERLAEPEDMVGPAIFLCSEASGYVTGQMLFVDGRRTCR